MKLMLRLLLGLLIVIAAVYVATPLWLPGLVERQLPENWRLESVKMAYPGLSGIHVLSLDLTAQLPQAELDIHASGVHVAYREFRAQVSSLSVDAYLPEAAGGDAGVTRPGDLSIPMAELPGGYRDLSIGQLSLAVHQKQRQANGELMLTRPLEMAFRQVTLQPRPGQGFHLAAKLHETPLPVGSGWLEVDHSAGTTTADLKFPADRSEPKWLAVHARQQRSAGEATTEVNLDVDTGATDSGWLDSIITQHSDGLWTHAGGRFRVNAIFSGATRQQISSMALDTEDLQLVLDGETLDLSAALTASREGGNIVIDVRAPTRIGFRDGEGRLDQWIGERLPGLERTAHSAAQGSLLLAEGGRVTITPGDPPAIHFHGDSNLDLHNDGESLGISSSGLKAGLAAFPDLDSAEIDGEFEINFSSRGNVGYRSPVLHLSADSLAVAATVTSRNGLMTSDGSGELSGVALDDPETGFNRIDVQWRDLDPAALSGNLSTRTHGMKTVTEGRAVSGIDVDINYTITNGQRIAGSGNVLVSADQHLPIEFSGDIDEKRWNISVPSTTVETERLDRFFQVADLDMPAFIKLGNGQVDIEADVAIDNGISAKLLIDGHDIDVSARKSLAEDLEFSFTGRMDGGFTGNGPVSIRNIRLAGGIDINALEAGIEVGSAGAFSLRELQGGLLEGRLSIAELHYIDGGIGNATARLERINLGRLLAFADIDGLNGSGLLDVMLPVSQTATGFAINNGSFRSTVPGFLAYRSGAGSAGNIGLQALEDFQYQQLSGTIDYQPDGTYLITVQLEGNNPDLYDGYPLKFNLNINGSLPELFESLFVTGDFEEAILKEVKKRESM